MALLGPNGAGKTTTLLMLLGAITPDAGSITVVGHSLPKGRSAAMGEVGFVAGYLPLPDRLRVSEALSIFAGFYGMGRKAGEAAVEKGLERFKITHLADRMCMELSSGQRTLVGIVKAILHDPQLLVLDEPTASLDPDVAYRVRTGLLEVAANDGTALLVTSHNMVEVERLCERSCSWPPVRSWPTALPRMWPTPSGTATSRACSSSWRARSWPRTRSRTCDAVLRRSPATQAARPLLRLATPSLELSQP